MPIVILVYILNFFVGVSKDLLIKFTLGSLGVILGLSIFLSGVDLSISKIGTMMGDFLGRFDKIIKVIIFGIFIGFIISIAEPDLLILANQVSQAIGITPFLIVIIISLGVGLMISIGLYRIFKEISISLLMWIVYTSIFILMIFTSDTGHAIAYDASGATLVHGRGAGREQKSILLNMNIEPEKDIVIMLVKKDLMNPIKNAIYEEMNLKDENKGIIYSLPVMEVRGLIEQGS